MEQSKHAKSTVAQQIAEAALGISQQRTGPHSRLGHGGSRCRYGGDYVARRFIAGRASDGPKQVGAARVREFHRELFLNSAAPLREEIKRITGVEVREAARGGRTDDRQRGAGVHDRHYGAGIPARP